MAKVSRLRYEHRAHHGLQPHDVSCLRLFKLRKKEADPDLAAHSAMHNIAGYVEKLIETILLDMGGIGIIPTRVRDT